MGSNVQTMTATAARSAILVSSDLAFRRRVRDALAGLRWQVRETSGGAEALVCLDRFPAEAVVLDSWLPDLEVGEFVQEFRQLHPGIDLITVDASLASASEVRSPRRNEILHALRRAQAADGAIWNAAPDDLPGHPGGAPAPAEAPRRKDAAAKLFIAGDSSRTAPAPPSLPELIGSHPAMLEVSRRIRLVAPQNTSVLVEGPTGSGKELVARALHRLSPRFNERMVALNCAAIPESLLESELFGHTRGAFTGAVQGRVGRIESAQRGTLFLDEIGEMPLALQAKLLRFLETGELQRVGDNESVHVDVRIVAATHRPLRKMIADGLFRADLYYRLAVFLIRTPPLAGRSADIEALVVSRLAKMARSAAAKSITAAALARLTAYPWPGNVRELEHVLERAWILAEDRPQIDSAEIEFDDQDEIFLRVRPGDRMPACMEPVRGASAARGGGTAQPSA